MLCVCVCVYLQVCASAALMANKLEAAAIIVFTRRGYMAHFLSRCRCANGDGFVDDDDGTRCGSTSRTQLQEQQQQQLDAMHASSIWWLVLLSSCVCCNKGACCCCGSGFFCSSAGRTVLCWPSLTTKLSGGA